MTEAVELVEESFRRLADGRMVNHPRRRVRLANGSLLHAMEAGDNVSNLFAAKMYATGRGVPRDGLGAVRWWYLSAEQGNSSAQLALGRTFEQGTVVPRNDVNALMWYRLAAAQGSPAAAKRSEAISERMAPGQVARATSMARERSSRN